MQQLNTVEELEHAVRKMIDRGVLATNWILVEETPDGRMYDPAGGVGMPPSKVVTLTFRFVNFDTLVK